MALLTPQYQTEFYLGAIEELARNVDVFNGMSNGTLLIGSEDYMGDYIKESMYDRVSGLVTRRDVTVDTAVTALRMSLQEHVGVDVAHKIGPVFETYENFERRGRSIDEMANALGQQFAGDFIARGLDLIISAMVAATDGVAALKDDSDKSSATNVKHILKGQKLFGDQFKNVGAAIMNSGAFFDLVEDKITNYKIENVAGVQIVSGVTEGVMGKPIIVADVPSLTFEDTSVDYNRILLLTDNAGSVIERTGRRFVIDEKSGQENLGIVYQGETNTVLKVKGYAWDTTAGRNPTDAAVATTANWDLVTDSKNAACSMVVSLA
jgi:hypothetical protein